ncbi:hypothetical protein BH24PSE2_BH24PSE2_08360 [soil metagenome]
MGSKPWTIQWSEVAGIEQFLLEFDNESAAPEQSLTINLPPHVTSVDVPPSLLIPGADYQVGVATVAEIGNTVFVEAELPTSEQSLHLIRRVRALSLGVAAPRQADAVG